MELCFAQRSNSGQEGGSITKLLHRLETGDGDVMDDVIPLVYDELKKLARSHLRREGGPVPLETTALVHETFLKFANSRHPAYENRSHFYGIASRVMRQVLVDTARSRAAEKRGTAKEVALAEVPDWGFQPHPSILALDDALGELEKTDPLKAQIVEMRYFGGMTAHEISLALRKPVHMVNRGLRLAQAWLRKEMAAESVLRKPA